MKVTKAIRGHVDGFEGRFISGWAISDENEGTCLVEVSTPKGRVIARGRASHPREDLRGVGNGRSNIAFRIPVELQAGWNSLLLKFLHNAEEGRSGQFTFRVEERKGGSIAGLMASARRFSNPPQERSRGFRWLRIGVPPVAGALRIPPLRNSWAVWIDGKPLPASAEMALPKGARYVTMRIRGDEVLDRPFEFITAPTSLPLGTWTVPGLEHFSGRMTYEKTVEVPAALLAERVLLDCGQVGVAAEAWVNGESVGSRPWEPFVFDVSRHVRPGRNQIRVRIANTEANARAVGTSADILNNIDLNGWLGPAQLVPYFERTMVLLSA